MKVVICAGEASGDLLGAGLLTALRQQVPDLHCRAVAGSQLRAAGCEEIFPAERLSVMGISEVLKRLPELLCLRKQLIQTCLQDPPDVFIGIDAPDFNLAVEQALKSRGIKTVHYVSPSVWAWRKKRIFKIARATDLVLTLFPFELEIYKQHQVPAQCVGHTLADQIDLQEADLRVIKKQLNIDPTVPVLTILPGSRHMEIEQLAQLFFQSAIQFAKTCPNLQVIVPIATPQLKPMLEALWQPYAAQVPILWLEGQAQLAMKAADWVLITSGTATLEAMLLKKPMVVAYRMTGLNWWIAKHFIKVPFFALPNLLANAHLVPELIQDQVTVENLTQALQAWRDDPARVTQVKEKFLTLHQSLRQNASAQAAKAILTLLAPNP